MVRHDNPVRQIVLSRNVALPEVNPLFPNGFFALNERWQHLWKDINPLLSNRDWRALLEYERAFTNNNGFDNEADPRIDFINGKDLDAKDDLGKPAYPKLEMLLCGGAKFYGHISGDKIYVETLDGNKNPPPFNWLINNPYYWYRAVTISPNGYIRNLPQGGNHLPKRVPIVSKYPVYIEKSKVIEI